MGSSPEGCETGGREGKYDSGAGRGGGCRLKQGTEVEEGEVRFSLR